MGEGAGSLHTALNPRSAPSLALSLSHPNCKMGLMTTLSGCQEGRMRSVGWLGKY